MVDEVGERRKAKATVKKTTANGARSGGGDKKPTASELLVLIGKRDFEFRRNEQDQPYAIEKANPTTAWYFGGRSGYNVMKEIAYRYYADGKRKPPNAAAMGEARLILEQHATRGEKEALPLRVASPKDRNSIWIDLGGDTKDADGNILATCINVSPGKWSLEKRPPGTFLRTKQTLPYETPVGSGEGSLVRFRELFNVDDKAWDFLVSWMAVSFVPDIPHAAVIFLGEQGTAKTSTTKYLIDFIDPTDSSLGGPPKDAKQFMSIISASWAYAFENMSYMPPWMNDALCRAITGDGWRDRELYTDNQVHSQQILRVLALNGIEIAGIGQDLVDRSITLTLERIDRGARRTEEALAKLWEGERASAFGAILDILAKALKVKSSGRHELPEMGRMADFENWLNYVDIVRGTSTLDYFQRMQKTHARLLSFEDPVAQALVGFLVTQPNNQWKGTAHDLHVNLQNYKEIGLKNWPGSARPLAGRLTRLAPGLRSGGWIVEQKRKGNDKIWYVSLPEEAGKRYVTLRN